MSERLVCKSYAIKSPPVSNTYGRWTVRFVVLTEIVHSDEKIPRLCYYENERLYKAQEPKGEIILVDGETLEVAQISRVADHLVYQKLIAIITPSKHKAYYLALKTEQDMQVWLTAFQECIPGCVSGKVAYIRGVKLSNRTEPVSVIPGDSEIPSSPPAISAAATATDGAATATNDTATVTSRTGTITVDVPKAEKLDEWSGNGFDGRTFRASTCAANFEDVVSPNGGKKLTRGQHSVIHRHGRPVQPGMPMAKPAHRQSLSLPKSESFKRKEQAAPPKLIMRESVDTEAAHSRQYEPSHRGSDVEPALAEVQQQKEKLRKLTKVVLLSDIVAKAVRKLGEGNFGTVCEVVNKCQLVESHGKEAPFTVAIKTLKSNHSLVELNEFLSEACLLAQMDHEHVVRLMAVQIAESPCCIVMEVMNEGSLKSYLQDCSDEGISVPLVVKLWVMFQVAVAMNYISVKKGFLHRDLAARNILLHRLPNEEVIAKISDFGLAKNTPEYILLTQRTLPVKWLALETLRDGVYSHKTDVWSYAVTLWETMSDGSVPYAGVPTSDIYYRLEAGLKLKQPPECSDSVYSIIVACMDIDPERRPTFAKICHVVGRHIKAAAADGYVDDQVDTYLRGVNQIVEDKAALTERERRAAEEEDDGGYTPMLPARLAKTLPQPTAESVNSLGLAHLRRILICSDTTNPEKVQATDDLAWLRQQVLGLWSHQHSLLNTAPTSP